MTSTFGFGRKSVAFNNRHIQPQTCSRHYLHITNVSDLAATLTFFIPGTACDNGGRIGGSTRTQIDPRSTLPFRYLFKDTGLRMVTPQLEALSLPRETIDQIRGLLQMQEEPRAVASGLDSATSLQNCCVGF